MSAYSENYRLIDWSGFKPGPAEGRAEKPTRKGRSPYYMPDIAPFVSPMSGKVLSSRKQVRHEERGYGVRQCGEMNKPEHYDNSGRHPSNEKALERAYRTALEKTGLA